MTFSKTEIIAIVWEFYRINNRSPKLKDLNSLGFTKNLVKKIFGTWNKMLFEAQLPLNKRPPINIKCDNCGSDFKKRVKDLKKTMRDFCSRACNAQFYSTGRKHTQETKAKISASLKAHRIFINQ